jgi:hypothetical protein
MALNWRGPWNAGATYQIDDVVFYLTVSYVALDINTNQAPIQANIGTIWDTFAVGSPGPQGEQGISGNPGVQGDPGVQGNPGIPGATGQGFTWRNAWLSTVTYNAYDCVSYVDGNSYICISSGVIDVPPDSNLSKWNILAGIGTSQIYSSIGSPPSPIPPPAIGERALVLDATANTFGAVYTGGGSYIMPVWSDGVNWYVG